MTSVWPSPPSPSLDALSSEPAASSPFPLSWHLALTLPRRLWDAYVANLWHYQPNSWVGRVASTFRILAVMLVLPVVLLMLLDVTSYVIARTLGVVDDLKASTIDANTHVHAGTGTTCPNADNNLNANRTMADNRRGGTVAVGVGAGAARVAVAVPVPSARVPTGGVSHAPARASEGLAPEEDSVGRRADGDGCGCGHAGPDLGHEHAPGWGSIDVQGNAPCGHSETLQVERRKGGWTRSAERGASDESGPCAYYFAGEEDLRLAGEGVFSPAVSMPPSPLTPRFPLLALAEGGGRGSSGQVSEEEGVALRRRVQGAQEDGLVQT